MLKLLALAIMTQTDPHAPRPVDFSHTPPAATQSVAIVGSFNDWDRAAFPLEKQADGKTWKGTFKIAPGVYSYLLVENGNKWLPDPKAPAYPDANGNVNSKLVVQPLDYDERMASPDDEHITLSALQHRATREDCALVTFRYVRFKFRTRRGDVKYVVAHAGGEADLNAPHGLPNMVPLEVVAQDELFDTWSGRVPVSLAGPTVYYFSLVSGERGFYFGPLGLDRVNPFTQDFREYPLPNPPDWVQDSVFYQIFPERFANGSLANDPAGTEKWGTKPTGRNWMGGDLAGIKKNIGHLKELGVTGLYLNPVFEALSNHAYDTVDYENVDKRFGTNEELKDLIQDLKGTGINTILDAVFNHSSPEFRAFKDVREKGKSSPYKNWYFISGYPVEVKEGQKHYRTFAGVPTMPKLNQDDSACREYFLRIGEQYLKDFKAAGWRLDVADEVSQDFWRDFRKRVKAADPNAYILGEAWGDAHEYLQGDQHDAVMNYRWRKAVLDFFARGLLAADQFEKELRLIRDDYPEAVPTSMLNLLGSHDTERVRTIFKDDRERQALAVVFQFTYPGVPSIYYGDEIGMEGGKDPDCRRCMEWDRSKWDKELFSLHQQLIELRKKHPALRRGTYRCLDAKPGSKYIRFERKHGKETLRVEINSGTKPVKLAPTVSRFLLSRGVRNSQLDPGGFAIWKSG